MAIYRLSAQVISRADGRSATAAAAYRSGGRIADERTGEVYDYERRGGVEHEEIMAPANTPQWMLNREALWNAVERVEKRRDAQLCRELQLALPHEMDRAAQLELVRGFVRQEFVARGMIADIAIHASHRQGDPRNDHAHVMLTLREITQEGFGAKDRSWNDRALLGQWREGWAEHVNYALARTGHEDRVDHRTLEAQRVDVERQAVDARAANDNDRAEILEVEAVILDREPQPKIGHIAMALERRGERTERGDYWRSVIASNMARLQNWLRLQQGRLATAWEIVQAVLERDHGRSPPRPSPVGRDTSGADSGRVPDREARIYSQEQRDRLLGRRPPATPESRDEGERQAATPKPRGKGRDDDRER
ncbi:MobQ family relaxase [Devosia sp.]|uniref:MobQ family relaxase n=1 Tax=Devosia sp. TaxID=1871048 RepID=UPI003263F775